MYFSISLFFLLFIFSPFSSVRPGSVIDLGLPLEVTVLDETVKEEAITILEKEFPGCFTFEDTEGSTNLLSFKNYDDEEIRILVAPKKAPFFTDYQGFMTYGLVLKKELFPWYSADFFPWAFILLWNNQWMVAGVDLSELMRGELNPYSPHFVVLKPYKTSPELSIDLAVSFGLSGNAFLRHFDEGKSACSAAFEKMLRKLKAIARWMREKSGAVKGKVAQAGSSMKNKVSAAWGRLAQRFQKKQALVPPVGNEDKERYDEKKENPSPLDGLNSSLALLREKASQFKAVLIKTAERLAALCGSLGGL